MFLCMEMQKLKTLLCCCVLRTSQSIGLATCKIVLFLWHNIAAGVVARLQAG